MSTRVKRLLCLAIVVVMIGVGITGWAAVKVVAWARDLPSRIDIDGDGIAQAFGQGIVLSFHEGLTKGDTQTQTQILSSFSEAISGDDPAARQWIRSEYYADIRQLTTSADGQVAADATALLDRLQSDVP